MWTEKVSPNSNVDEAYKKGDWLIFGPLSNVESTADYKDTVTANAELGRM
jgi:hypothetical protein